MKFADIKGNDAAVGALRSMVESGRIPHALLFYENPGSGAFTIVQTYLQYLYCTSRNGGEPCGQCPACRQIAAMTHPDVHYVFPVNKGTVIKDDHPVSDAGMAEFRAMALANPLFGEQDVYDCLGVEGKSGAISVYEAKEIIGKLSLSSLTGSYKSVVLFLPERMNAQAANKLLKILEEPPSNTLFLMITQNPQDVMATIYSRCQGLRVLPPYGRASVKDGVSEEIPPLWNAFLDALLARDLSAALDAAEEIDALKSREKQKVFCIFASRQLRNVFLVQRSLGDLADISSDDADRVARAASALPRNFCPRAVSCLDKAVMLLSRNVSSKMIFVNLADRLYMYM